MSKEKILEDLLQSIQLLIDKSLESFPTDSVEICRITDTSNRKNGIYKATPNDQVVYEVHGQADTYRVNDKVTVLIPKDDTINKQILGRYLEEGYVPTEYVSQEDKLIPATGNLFLDNANIKKELAANDENLEVLYLYEIKGESLRHSKNYNTLYLKADFKCLLDEYLMRQGNYGLLLVGYYDELKTQKAFAMMLDSSDMFGNPYSFLGYFKQEKLFFYESNIDINNIDVYFYQKNNFKYFDGTSILPVPVLEDSLPSSEEKTSISNIFVKDIIIYLGYDVASIDDNTVKIFSNDSLTYESGDLIKHLELIWYNKNENNKFLGFTDGQFNNEASKKASSVITEVYNIENQNLGYRYQYFLLDKDYSQFYADEEYEIGTKVYYQDKNSFEEKNLITGICPYDKPQYSIEWYSDNANGAIQQVANNVDATELDLECHLSLTETEVYALVWCDGNSYKSNTIKYTNDEIKKDNANNLGITLSFTHIDPGQSLYSFYGADNRLIDMSQKNKKRKIQVNWTSKAGTLPNEFWAGARIVWTLPESATMLVPTEKDKFVYEFDGVINNSIFEYQIRDTFNYLYRNNKIKCKIILPDNRGEINGEETILFSSFGTSGTNYTFTIGSNKENGIGALGEEVEFFAKLNDADGNELSLDDVSWYKYPEKRVNESLPKWTVPNNITELYNVIKATTKKEWAGQSTILQAFYPVIYSKEEKYYAQVPTQIFYDSFGTIYDLDLPPLKLFNLHTNEEISEIVWELIYNNDELQKIDETDTSFYEAKNKGWIPTLHLGEEGQYSISPPSFYIDTGYYPILRGYLNNEIVWTSPIIISQYRYGSTLLNNWDGNLQIDEDNNTILAAMMGAGVKNDDNTFSGVIMGQLKKVDYEKEAGDTGLIGYNHGQQSFGFKDDGTAFIGKSGKGRIEFDGNEAIIKSTAGGMEINLEQGTIRSDKFSLQSEDDSLILNSHPESFESYLKVGNTEQHIDFNSEGKLNIKVSSLEITGGMDSTNLLKQSEPLTNILEQIPWRISNSERGKVQLSLRDDEYGRYYAVQGKVDGLELDVGHYLYQTVHLDSFNTDVNYTLSADVWSDSENITLACWRDGWEGVAAKSFNNVGNSFKRVHFTFTIPKNSPAGIYLFGFGGTSLTGTSTKGFWIRKPKLEKGTTATEWTPHPDDARLYVDGQTYLKQGQVFNALTNGGENSGLWLEDNELYINGNYIATGILHDRLNANDWSQVLETDTNGKLKVNKNKLQSISSGMYMWLDEGEIWAKSGNGDSFIFSKDGLSISASSLDIQATTENSNLLSNTEPQGSTVTPWMMSNSSAISLMEVALAWEYDCYNKNDNQIHHDTNVDKNSLRYGYEIRPTDRIDEAKHVVMGAVTPDYFPTPGSKKTTKISGAIYCYKQGQWPLIYIYRYHSATGGSTGEFKFYYPTGRPFSQEEVGQYVPVEFYINDTNEFCNNIYGGNWWIGFGIWENPSLKGVATGAWVSSPMIQTSGLISTYSSHDGKYFEVKSENVNQFMCQAVNLPDRSYFTFSADIFSYTGKITLGIWKNVSSWEYIDSASFSIPTSKFYRIRHTFKKPDGVSSIIIGVRETEPGAGSIMWVRYPKLEEGMIATNWNIKPAEVSTQTFQELTKGGTIKGIFLRNNNLYINADYIASGILTDSNENFKIDLNRGEISIGQKDATKDHPLLIYAQGSGYARLGTPLYTTESTNYQWKDITFMPVKDDDSNGAIGNLGTPDHPWDVVCYDTAVLGSNRAIKKDINIYNVENAYEELKNLPIYTFSYIHNTDNDNNNIKLGSMIDYMPNEVIHTNPNEVLCYDSTNMMFWNIAATQALQNRVEDLMARVESLEQKEV